MNLKLALLAGGKASRLLPLTESIPKSLIQISGKPFINWQLELIKSWNIQDVIICVGIHADQIVDYVGDGSKFELNVKYSYDGSENLGTGGALRNAQDLLGESFAVVYGDSYLDLDFNKAYSYFLNTNNKPTMCVYKNINNLIQNNINLNGDKVLEYNKLTPKTNFNFVDYGMSFIPTRLLREFPTTNPRFDLSDFFQFLVGKKLLRGYKVGSRFYEIGSLAGIKELSDKMESKWNI